MLVPVKVVEALTLLDRMACRVFVVLNSLQCDDLVMVLCLYAFVMLCVCTCVCVCAFVTCVCVCHL